MINSRDLALLREDVARNVRTLIERCDEEGLPVLITQTVRDDAYQAKLYAQGRTAPGRIVTNAKTTSFHGKGLAVDFCKDSRTGAYSDSGFFNRVIELAKEMGFSSGRDWRSFPELCHLQWDDGGTYTAAMVRAGNTPPPMPDFLEESMDGKDIYEKLNAYCDGLEVPAGVRAEWQQCIDLGLTDGSHPCRMVPAWRAFIVAKRAMERAR